MELLIFSGTTYMDDLKESDVVEYEKNYPGFTQKYNARYQAGDVIEVQEDGFFDNRGFRKDKFKLLKRSLSIKKQCYILSISLLQRYKKIQTK